MFSAGVVIVDKARQFVTGICRYWRLVTNVPITKDFCKGYPDYERGNRKKKKYTLGKGHQIVGTGVLGKYIDGQRSFELPIALKG